jgi:alginate O-acetyltransferase complex protein AlgI
MAFNSYVFFVLLGLAVAVFRLLPQRSKARQAALLATSYAFYALFSLPLLSLLLASTLTDFYVAQAIARASSPRRRKALLGLSLGMNLGLLGGFKYLDFALANLSAALGFVGASSGIEPVGLAIPLGISFYTFQTLGYTIDVYRGRQRPEPSPLTFACFVAFFPQLVAGPIERAGALLPQLRAPASLVRGQVALATTLIAVGLFKKTVLADNLAPIAETVYSQATLATLSDAWVGTYAFGVQIWADFSGYCDIAVGVALLFGVQLSDNFRAPYASASFSELWRRWHVTLSAWLRDYLYIPLGGNRRGSTRTAFNLMATMLLGGLWHGAAWTFVAWGFLHGLFLMLERPLRSATAPTGWRRLLRALVVFHAVMITWIFFRAESIADAFALVKAAFVGANGVFLTQGRALGVLALTAGVFCFHQWTRERRIETRLQASPLLVQAVLVGLLLAACRILRGPGVQFIYFQF